MILKIHLLERERKKREGEVIAFVVLTAVVMKSSIF
jgi:hypothetical protein